MSNELKDMLERIQDWPEELQEDAIASLLAIEQGIGGVYELSPDDCAALERSADDVKHGRFASVERVNEVLGRYRAT